VAEGQSLVASRDQQGVNPMNPERWRQIDQLLEAALERRPEERAAFLAVACADDESLRLEVESLLRSDEAVESFIEEPVVALAAEVIAEQPAEALAGRRIGHYKILSRLGAGGMGEVYLAEDLRLARKVAIKFLPPALTADEEARKRLLREARAAAALDHQNICAIHEVGDEAGRSFIVMQYVEGETLAARIKRERLELSEALAIATQVAEALQEAHQHGIIHRDVKPQNLMLTARGQVKVLDFGLAKLTEPATPVIDSQTSTLVRDSTESGMVMGTLRYMSPEQARGLKVDQRTDIFSLGVTLYEMIAGRRPFEGATMSDVIAALLTAEPLPLRQHRPEAPAEMGRIVGKCLVKDPEARYQSAHELLIDLKSLKRDSDRDLAPIGIAAVRSFSGDKRREHKAQWRLYLYSHRRALILSTLILIGAISLILRLTASRTAIPFAPRDWILVADVDNQTADPLFDRSLFTALSVSLAQSTHSNVFPRSLLGEALKRMGKTEDQRIDESLGLEICQRENIRALVVCSLSKFGGRYVLAYRLIDPLTGGTVRSQMEPSLDQDHILEALDRIAAGIRRDLGESLASIQMNDRPLPKVTTSSLQALKLFADERAAWRQGKWQESVQLCHSALQHDPDFAMVHADLGNRYLSHIYNYEARGREHYEKAMRLSDRATHREQLYIQASYHSDLGHFDEAFKFFNLYLNAYPDDSLTRSKFGYSLMRNAHFEEAIAQYQDVIRVVPNDSRASTNLASCYVQLGKLEEALKYYEKSIGLDPTAYDVGNLNHEYGFTLVMAGKEAKAREVFTKGLADPKNKALALRSLALLGLYQGKYREAGARLQEAVSLNEAAKEELPKGRNLIYLAYILGARGDMRGRLRELDRAARAWEKADPGVGAWFWALTIGIYYARSGAAQKASRVMTLVEKNLDRNKLDDLALFHRLDGEIELARGNSARALELLHLADNEHLTRRTPERRDPLIVESLAHAYQVTGNPEQAILWYERLLGLVNKPLQYEPLPFWLEAHYHLAQAYVSRGQKDKARRPIETLLTIWKDADSDLPLLEHVRRLRAELEN